MRFHLFNVKYYSFYKPPFKIATLPCKTLAMTSQGSAPKPFWLSGQNGAEEGAEPEIRSFVRRTTPSSSKPSLYHNSNMSHT